LPEIWAVVSLSSWLPSEDPLAAPPSVEELGLAVVIEETSGSVSKLEEVGVAVSEAVMSLSSEM